ncbi:MAG: protein kinase [Planctomycetes bacterium]|nr:protein kinase [Planctomycetota bacterium]
MSDEPEFVDHRPESGEDEEDSAEDLSAADGGELLFAESAGEALSGTSGTSGARTRTPPPPRSASGRHARVGSGSRGRSSGRLKRRGPPPTGRHARVSSGKHSAVRPGSRSGPHPASRSGPRPQARRPGGDSGVRPPGPPPAEHQAAAALMAQVKPAPEGDPYVNRELGPFKVEGFLGMDRGERRYVGTHTESKELALLRVYPLKGSYAQEFAKLAVRGERACRVQHPQLATALGVGKSGDCFFVGTAPPAGKLLSELLAEGEPLAPDALKTLLTDVGGALGALHQRQLVHANVSPKTIRLHEDRWFLHDPGLSRPRAEFDFLSAGGEVLGEPGFIAPETVDSGEQTSASDLYALGCVAWTALSLKPPFTGDDPVQVLLDQLNVDVPPVAGVEGKAPVPDDLAVLVGKLCGYTPAVRYGAARELLSDLKGLERGDVPAPFASDLRKDEEEPDAEKLGSGRALVIVLAGLNVLALGALFLVFLRYSSVTYADPLESFSFPDLTAPAAAPGDPAK